MLSGVGNVALLAVEVSVMLLGPRVRRITYKGRGERHRKPIGLGWIEVRETHQ